MVLVSVLDPPAFVTVSFTVNLPAFEYAWVGCFSVEVVPSPKSQLQDVGFPVEVSMNWTVSVTFPLVGLPLKEALGAGVEAGLMVKVFA